MGSITHSKGSFDGIRGTRAVALVGPAGTGKTSLAEALLFASGAITRQGSVDAGTSIGDSSPEARARHGSTEINLMQFDYLDERFALIDVPGGAGFAVDGLAALQSADLALVVIDPTPERTALAEPMLRRLDELGLPHAIFVNKIENARAGAVRELIAELQPLSREPLALRQIPIRKGDAVAGYVDLALERAYAYRPGAESQRIDIPDEIAEREREDRTILLETLADFDDGLLEALLEDETPDPALVMADLAADTAQNKIVPVVLGSAQSGGGVHRLLKLIRHETPSSEAAARRIGAEDGKLHVFKIANGGAMGRLSLVRVFATPLNEGDDLVVEGEQVRAGAIFSVQGAKMTKQASGQPGDIVGLAKIDTAQGNRLIGRKGASDSSALLIEYPPRNASLAIETRDRRDDVKLATALRRLAEEDPALEWLQDDASHETVLRGINDEHVQLTLDRLQQRYGVAVDTHPPSIAYRESIRKAVTQRGRHKKQSGGHGQYGDVTIEVAPLPRGAGFEFGQRISGGVVPKQWIPAVEAGVRDAMSRGPMGFPVVDVAVILIDGSYHSVDSSELAFRIAGRLAMAEALAAASPYLLEPVCRIAVDTPGGSGSKVSSVLSSRRGQILGLGPHPTWSRWERVEAMLPEAGLHGLDSELRAMSQGLASYTAGFDHLAELNGKQADEVVKAKAELAA